VNPLQHYEQFGFKEGRDPSANFDTLGYLAATPTWRRRTSTRSTTSSTRHLRRAAIP